MPHRSFVMPYHSRELAALSKAGSRWYLRVGVDPQDFDRFADAYAALHRKNVRLSGEDPAYFAEYKVLETRRLVDARGVPHARLLDFGAGVGSSLPFFRKYFPSSRLTLTDPSVRSLAVAKERFPGEEIVVTGGQGIPLGDDTFDVVFSACVFHHIPHVEHARWLAEIRRVLRRGGMLVIFEHNPYNPLTVHAVSTCPFDANAHLIRASALAARVSRQGFSATSTRYHLFFPRLLAPLRPLEARLGWLPLGAQYSLCARKA